MAGIRVKHDTYCWRCCHKNTSLKCSNCVRAFHKKCAPIDGLDDSTGVNWLCPVCTTLKTSENIDKESDLEILPVIIKKLWQNESFDILKYPMESPIHSNIVHSIVNPMDLSQIIRKTYLYTDFNEFYADICWIVHNCVILFTENHENTKAARSLLNCVVGDIQMAKKCFECYLHANEHPNEWFSMVCNDPHLIIWVKKTGANYWPAKLMCVTGQEVNVRLFGDHIDANVSAKNCLLYSESSPSRIRKPSDAYSLALKEANKYITNLTKKFGSFRFAEIKTAFNPTLLEYYVAQLIPGSGRYRQIGHAAHIIDTIDLCSEDLLETIEQAAAINCDEEEHLADGTQNSSEIEAVHNCSYEHRNGSEGETESHNNSSSTVEDEQNDFVIIDW